MEITLENLKIGNILKQYELSKILYTVFIRNIEVDGWEMDLLLAL